MLTWFLGLIVLALYRKRYPVLSEIQPLPAAGTPLPTLSILVPACNEAETIAPAMQSLLALDYPNLEILAVNDRSTDATGVILDRMAAQNSRLRVLHITTLPKGWLGKNHALQVAAQEATGEWLLFTDADVVYRYDTMLRAVCYAEKRCLDHLVVSPHCEAHGFWEKLFLSFFGLMYSFRIRIWEIENPRNSAYVGFGAFNLVRAAAYHRMGGHRALPMETVDDMKLGKLLKRSGARPSLVRGLDLISVRWMIGLRGVVDGLTKNAFAAYDFSLIRAVGSVLGMLLLALFPAFVLLLPGSVHWLGAGAFVAMALGAGATRRTCDAGAIYGLCYPLAALVLSFIVLRSIVRTYRQNGIVWRGTHYTLKDLRNGIV